MLNAGVSFRQALMVAAMVAVAGSTARGYGYMEPGN